MTNRLLASARLVMVSLPLGNSLQNGGYDLRGCILIDGLPTCRTDCRIVSGSPGVLAEKRSALLEIMEQPDGCRFKSASFPALHAGEISRPTHKLTRTTA
jgi:hypothetical protein